MEKFDALGLDGRQLKLFLTILDTGSVSAAAEAYGLNQSTGSHHLDKLRRAMGDPLFVKLGKGVSPTDFAIALAPRVRALVASLEGLSAEVEYDPASDSRPVTLAANTAECRPLLRRFSEALTRDAPNAPQRFLELGSRDTIERMLEAGQADLILSIRSERYPASVKSIEFSLDRFVCFYDEDARGPVETIKDYCEAGHAALDFGGGRKSTITKAIEHHGFTRQILMTVPDVGALSEMILGTDLIATFQSNLATSACKGLATCPVPLALPPVYQDLVWHRRQDASPRNKWLRERILACRDALGDL